MNQAAQATGLLGDHVARDYSRKLDLFNAFAQPELLDAIATLHLQPGMRVLDAGCGTGHALSWLLEKVMPGGTVTGIDLAAAHVTAARTRLGPRASVLLGDLFETALTPGEFDLIWCVNTINHLRDPLSGARKLGSLLRPGGRLVLGQSSFVPDMYFAWDARLERLTNEAVRDYYRDRYHLSERALTAVRSLVGLMRQAPFLRVHSRTFMIERTNPLDSADEAYLAEAIFRDTWGDRLRPYLPQADYDELTRLCDPEGREYALRRPDFHFLQSFTLVVGQVMA